MSELRHVKCFCIPARMLERLVREGATVRCMRGIPADAKLVGMGEDFVRDGFTFAFEHPSFPIPDAALYPPVEWVVFEEVTEADTGEMKFFTVRYGP